MLVVISDIHLVDGTAGEHNVPPQAFENVFLDYIPSLAQGENAKELKVLLLGDIVDLIRTEQWLSVPFPDRPWGDNGLKDIRAAKERQQVRGTKTEERCLKILRDIEKKNRRTFEVFRKKLVEKIKDIKGESFDVELIYVPGNHDRLVNVYPRVRDELGKMLGLTVKKGTVDGDPAGEDWWYRHKFEDKNYGVFARHGHEYDPMNYGDTENLERIGQIEASFGEVFATEFAVRVPWWLSKMLGADELPGGPLEDGDLVSLREDLKEDEDRRRAFAEFVARTKDMDNIRPLSGVLEYFYYRSEKVKGTRPWFRKALDEAIDRALEEFFKVGFVQKWRSPGTTKDTWLTLLSNPVSRIGLPYLLDLVEVNKALLPFIFFKEAREKLSDPTTDPYTRAAYEKEAWKDNHDIRYILYGHTHDPLIHPLDVREDIGEDGKESRREIRYINTGTWRSAVRKTTALDKDDPDYVPNKQMTYLVFYSKDEDLGEDEVLEKEPGTISFDMWTGAEIKRYAR